MESHTTTEPDVHVVDGRDALAFLIIRPSADGAGFAIESGASGMTRKAAAVVLLAITERWLSASESEN